jgi:hypothetical protein
LYLPRLQRFDPLRLSANGPIREEGAGGVWGGLLQIFEPAPVFVALSDFGLCLLKCHIGHIQLPSFVLADRGRRIRVDLLPHSYRRDVHVESHPYLPERELLDYCRKNGIVLQAFAALGHSGEPKLLDDPIIAAIARRVDKTPAQVLLAWGIQRGTALLTTSKTPSRIKENFDVSTLPESAMREINEGIKLRVRLNAVVETGVPGFIPRGR